MCFNIGHQSAAGAAALTRDESQTHYLKFSSEHVTSRRRCEFAVRVRSGIPGCLFLMDQIETFPLAVNQSWMKLIHPLCRCNDT